MKIYPTSNLNLKEFRMKWLIVFLVACSACSSSPPILGTATSAVTNTVVKRFHFDTDAEGFASDNALSPQYASFGYVSSDSASGSGGSVAFTLDPSIPLDGSEALGYAGNGSGTVTWESWGVPSGATVVSVQVTGWETKVASAANLGGHGVSLFVENSQYWCCGGPPYFNYDETNGYPISELSVGGFLDTSAGDWTTQGNSVVADTTSDGAPSTATPTVELSYYASPDDTATPAAEVRLDEIELTITYTGP